MGLYTWAAMIFGFIFIQLVFILTNEFFSSFQDWGLAFGSGYDTNAYNFMIGLWGIIDLIFFISLIMYGVSRTQKTRSDFR